MRALGLGKRDVMRDVSGEEGSKYGDKCQRRTDEGKQGNQREPYVGIRDELESGLHGSENGKGRTRRTE